MDVVLAGLHLSKRAKGAGGDLQARMERMVRAMEEHRTGRSRRTVVQQSGTGLELRLGYDGDTGDEIDRTGE